MHGGVVTALADNPILTLFIVIGLGYLLGEIAIFGFRVGVVGVLFVGLAVGSLGPTVSVPEVIPTLGLIIFIYTIGLQSGPEFFKSLRQRGYRDSLFALLIVALGAGMTLLVSRPAHLTRARAAGLYTGAMTNTPALAAVRELLVERGRAAGFSPQQLQATSDDPVVAYSIAYPVGVIGVLLSFAFLRRRWKPDMEPAEAPEIRARDFEVINPAVIDRTLEEVLRPHRDPGFVVSRVQHGDCSDIARSETHLRRGDIVVAVGDDDGLRRAEQIFGQPLEAHIEQDRSEIDFRRVFVSRQDIVGKRIRELDLENTMGATVTRLRRGDMDFVPTKDTRLELGDRVRVLTRRENFAGVSRFFGDSIRGTAETDFGSVALGMVLGVLVGLAPIPLPGGAIIRLGFAGGPLLVSLILGKLERTGRITWIMPLHSNLTLRQIGLLFFLSGVGIRAGYSFAQTLRQNGLSMLLVGALVTLVVTEVSLFVGYKVLKIPFASLMGLVSGIQTQPACLAYATRESNSDAPNISYAAVYPVAMIGKIILAQLLL